MLHHQSWCHTQVLRHWCWCWQTTAILPKPFCQVAIAQLPGRTGRRLAEGGRRLMDTDNWVSIAGYSSWKIIISCLPIPQHCAYSTYMTSSSLCQVTENYTHLFLATSRKFSLFKSKTLWMHIRLASHRTVQCHVLKCYFVWQDRNLRQSTRFHFLQLILRHSSHIIVFAIP